MTNHTNKIKGIRKAKRDEYKRLSQKGIKTSHPRMKQLAEEIFLLDQMI